MKNKISVVVLSLLLLVLMTSCALEAPEIPQSELFTRNFIKEFGPIDPNQTWNMAKSTVVTIVPAEGGAKSVKVYGLSGRKYHIVADVTDVAQRTVIPLDLPSNVNELKVVVDGVKYFTTVGSVVEADLAKSRHYMDADERPDETINADRIQIEDGSREFFYAPVITSFFRTLPEGANGRYDSSYPGNLFEPGIKTDFLLSGKGKWIEIFPIYWNTCQTHELGIYYFSGSEKNNSDIVRLPFYRMEKSPEFENIYYKYVEQNETRQRWGTELLTNGEAVPSNGGEDCYLYHNSETAGELNAEMDLYEGRYCWKVTSTDRAAEGAQDYDSQFFICLPNDKTIDPDKRYQITFNVRAAQPASRLGIEFHADPTVFYGIGNNGESDITTLDIPSDRWATFQFTGKIKKYGSTTNPANTFALSLNTPGNNANTYYFNNISWKEEEEYQYDISEWQAKAKDDSYRNVNDGTWTYYKYYYGTDGVTVDNTLTETFTASKDMSSAHLLLSETGDESSLICPLADVQWPNRVHAYPNDYDGYIASKSIRIFIPSGLQYGFYVHFNDMFAPHNEKYVYSEVDGNIEFMERKHWGIDLDPRNPQDRLYATFCAMFDQPIDDSTTYTYLTFEDWTVNSDTEAKYNGDYDLNDLAFLVKNVNIEEDLFESEDQFNFLVCAEDLGVTDDFDFNDIIFGVNAVTYGSAPNLKKRVKFTALAAGGTLPLYLYYKDTLLKPDGMEDSDGEWHKWFGSVNSNTMINTQNDKSYIKGKSCIIDVDADEFTLQGFGAKVTSNGTFNSLGGLRIKVGSTDYDVYNPANKDMLTTIEPPQPGAAPQMFMIEDVKWADETRDDDVIRTWMWASERKSLQTIYPDFINWAKGNGSSYSDWYKDESLEGVYTKRPD